MYDYAGASGKFSCYLGGSWANSALALNVGANESALNFNNSNTGASGLYQFDYTASAEI